MNIDQESKILSILIDYQCYLLHTEKLTQSEYSNIYRTIKKIENLNLSERLIGELKETKDLLKEKHQP